MTIDVGSGDGVKVDDSVLSGEGLVGRVASVEGSASQVTLITDHASAISAKVVPNGVQGVIRPDLGEPEELILDYIDSTQNIGVGQAVVTSGWRAQGLSSIFPPDLPVGEVTQRLAGRAEGEPAGAAAALRGPRQPRSRPGPDRRAEAVIVTPRITVRLAAIVIVGVLLQLSFFSRVALFHTSPDVLPALVVSLGLLGGSMTGAVAGFSIGLLVDCLMVEALGATSLVLLSTGYLAGLFRERFDIHSVFVAPLMCMGLTLFAEVGYLVGAGDAGHRFPGQPVDRQRHAAQIRIRLLPRLADLPRGAAHPAPGPGRGAGGPSPLAERAGGIGDGCTSDPTSEAPR